MTRAEKAVEKYQNGYNCAQAVICACADMTEFTEEQLFKLAEGFGGGMGATGGVCGAVSAMVFLAGLKESGGLAILPNTNKAKSCALAREMMLEFEEMNKSIICSEIKGKALRSCAGCVEDAVKIIEKMVK